MRWSRPVSRVLYAVRRDSHSSRPGVAAWLQQPTREQRGPRYRSPIRSCSGWGLPCRTALAPYAVRSYRTLSPLPVPLRAIGGLLSVALAVSSRCPGVTWHPALWSPDFPRRAQGATRLSGRLRLKLYRDRGSKGPQRAARNRRLGCKPQHRHLMWRSMVGVGTPTYAHPSPLSPYNIFRGAPVMAAANFAAFAGGNSSRKIANTRCPSTSFASASSPRPATSTTHSPRC